MIFGKDIFLAKLTFMPFHLNEKSSGCFSVKSNSSKARNCRQILCGIALQFPEEKFGESESLSNIALVI